MDYVNENNCNVHKKENNDVKLLDTNKIPKWLNGTVYKSKNKIIRDCQQLGSRWPGSCITVYGGPNAWKS